MGFAIESRPIAPNLNYSGASGGVGHGKIGRFMELIINGEARPFTAPLTVAALVEALGYTGKRIAVERNGDIVPRGCHGDTPLAEGDRIEIVVAVGGG